MFPKKSGLACTVAAVAGLAVSTTALATNGILQPGNGMVALGLGGAGIANPSEANAGADNPALIAGLGTQYGIGLSLFSPDRSANQGSGYVESDSKYFLIPQGAYVAPISKDFSWGVMVNAMGGMDTDYNIGGMRVGVNLSGVLVAPTVSYRLAPNFSAGASLLLGYVQLKDRNAPSNEIDQASGWGVKLGLYAEPVKGMGLGVTFQPEMHMGRMDKYCTTMLAGAEDCAINLPQMMGLGTRIALVRNLSLLADIVKADWSTVQAFDSFGWKDQTLYKVGMEYQLGGGTALRLGFNHGRTPIDAEVLTSVPGNVLFPAVTEDHLTLGLGMNLGDGMTLNGYLLHAFENEVMAAGGLPAIKMSQNAIGVGLNWTTK